MPRNCLIAIAVWIVLFAGYSFFFFQSDLPLEGALLGGAMMSFLVGLGLAMMSGARHAGSDRAALARFRRGERPQDGDAAAAIGEIWPVFEPLHAPLSGRDCVAYRYDIGAPRGVQTAARDYIGFAFTRCAVRTPYGSYVLGVFPVLEGFAEEPGDAERAREYVAATQFEPVTDAVAFAKFGLALHHQPAPFRLDWRLGDPKGNAEESHEVVVTSGTRVTAFGRFSSAENALVSGEKNAAYLRLYRGEHEGVPSSALAQLVVGTGLVIVANVVMWIVLQNLASR